MRANPLREKWSTGETAYGGWMTIPSSVTAEVMAVHDLDYLCVDMQHGLVGYADSVSMLQAVSLGSATPLVRVPENTTSHISKALDAGAMGVIVPMVNTVEEAEAAARACFYAPKGGRSYGPTRVAAVEGTDYFASANATVACIPMIETMEAIDNLEGIVAVEGVDAVYVGPADLAVSMGLAPGTDDPKFLDTLARVVETCDRHGVVPGCHATPATAADRVERGFRMVTVVADLLVLRAGSASAVAQARGVTISVTDALY